MTVEDTTDKTQVEEKVTPAADANLNEEAPKTGPVGESDDEALGDAGKRALIAERAARKEAEKRLSELDKRIEEFEDGQRTEEEKRLRALEKQQKRNSELDAENAKLKRELLIRDVVAEVGLPNELTGRLRGDDYETLLADAKELKELVAPDKDTSPRRPAPVPQAGNVSDVKISNGELFAQTISDAFSRQ